MTKSGDQLGPIEPEIYAAIGRLCSSWSALELLTEQTIVGLLACDYEVAKLITWPKDMRGRWELLISLAGLKLSQRDVEYLKKIQSAITTSTKDRNIIVHGLVTALIDNAVRREGRVQVGGTYAMTPAWTVFRGSHAGKRFPISLAAVELVISNLAKLHRALIKLNDQYNFRGHFFPETPIDRGWPEPIDEIVWPDEPYAANCNPTS